jgi:hypothetical protein
MSVPLSQSIVRVTELEELVSMLEIIPVAAVADFIVVSEEDLI